MRREVKGLRVFAAFAQPATALATTWTAAREIREEDLSPVSPSLSAQLCREHVAQSPSWNSTAWFGSVYRFRETALNARALRGCAPPAILSKPGIKPDFR